MAKRKRRKRKPRKLVYDTPEGGSYNGPSEGGRYFSRLAQAIERGKKDLSVFRQQRRSAVQQYVGRNYSYENDTPRQPLNMIDLAVSTITRYLVGQAPRALARTKIPDYKPAAHELGLALNEVIQQIKLLGTLQNWTFNAMFSLSIVKTGIHPEGEVEVEGAVYDAMGVFAKYVDIEDWVHDTTARDWRELQFMGDRHRVPYDFFMESGLYKKSVIDGVPPSPRDVVDSGGDERMETLTYPHSTTHEPYAACVELYDIWLPDEKVVVSLVTSGNSDLLLPVREVEWTGPEHGPYHSLMFKPVPRSVMPLPPVASLLDLHRILNAVYSKSANQAIRQKDITFYSGQASKDAERVRDASDGELIRADNPDKVTTQKFGGVDQVGLAFAIDARGQFSYHAGNLDALAGLSPQADTLGQDRMLRQSASQQIDDMQDKTSAAVAGLLRDIAFYVWDDPLTDIPISVRFPGDEHEMLGRFTQKSKDGKFFDYVIDIVPYSLRYRSPQEILQLVQGFVQQVVVPLAPQMAQQGISLDFSALVKLYADYGNLPELEDILSSVQPDELVPGNERPRQSPNTTRTNVRINRPGGTQGGKDAALTQNLLGGGAPPSQNAALMRPTG